MTNTLYQNIQTLGNKMATNLTTMGVPSTFNEGGLTLADKILEIEKFNNGLLLSADKNIGQNTDTIHLTAMLIQNSTFKIGVPLIIEDKVNTTPIYTKTYSNADIASPDLIDESIGCSRWFLMFDEYTGSGDAPFAQVRNSHGDYFRVTPTSTGFEITANCSLDVGHYSATLTGTILYYCNGVIFTDTTDSSIITDYTVTDFEIDTLHYLEGGVDFYRIYGGGITDDSGVVTGVYKCTGAGKKEFVARLGSA